MLVVLYVPKLGDNRVVVATNREEVEEAIATLKPGERGRIANIGRIATSPDSLTINFQTGAYIGQEDIDLAHELLKKEDIT